MKSFPAIPSPPPNERRETGLLLKLSAACLLVRSLCFLLSQNIGWDAVTRSLTALEWAKHPFIVPPTGYPAQYGPLPIYLFGLGLKLYPDVYLVPRLINLLIGSACVIPFYLWVKTAFSSETAVTASYLFVFYTLQAKSCVLAASEPLFIFCWLFSLYFFYRYQTAGEKEGDLLPAGFWLSLAGMCRYNGWLYIGIFGLILLKSAATGNKLRTVSLFGTTALLFPLLWMGACLYSYGNPLYPLKFIRSDHLKIIRQLGGIGLFRRIYYLFFFPAVLGLSLSPPAFLESCKGIVSTIKQRRHREKLLIGGSMTAYLTWSAVVGGNFLLFSRFAMEAGVVLIPLALVRETKAYLVTTAAVSFVLLILGGHFLPGAAGRKLSSVSPIAELTPSQKKVVRFIREKTSPGDRILLPHTLLWEEVEIRFYARHPNFVDSWNERQPPRYLIIRKGTGPVTRKEKPLSLVLDTPDFLIYKVAYDVK
ncbi:MAG: glycosyltransferase family 39 protein [bacterium]